MKLHNYSGKDSLPPSELSVDPVTHTESNITR